MSKPIDFACPYCKAAIGECRQRRPHKRVLSYGCSWCGAKTGKPCIDNCTEPHMARKKVCWKQRELIATQTAEKEAEERATFMEAVKSQHAGVFEFLRDHLKVEVEAWDESTYNSSGVRVKLVLCDEVICESEW